MLVTLGDSILAGIHSWILRGIFFPVSLFSQAATNFCVGQQVQSSSAIHFH